MRSFLGEEISCMSRRDVLVKGMVAGLCLILPGMISCKGKATPVVGKSLTTITLSDLQGKKMMIPADCLGKVTLLHFWASWCPTCRGEMQNLDVIGNEYRDRGAFPCSIGVGEQREAALSYIGNMNITYPILLDPHAETKRAFGVNGIPTYYILDREGIIRHKILGKVDRSELDKMVRMMV